MIKVKFKGFEKAERMSRDKINKALSDPVFLNKVGDKFTKNLKQHLLQGRDPGTAKDHENQLAKATIERRDKIARYNITDKLYKVDRPLVFSGKLVRSLAYKISKSKPLITIIAEGMHPVYRAKGGRKIGKAIENQKLLEFHHLGVGQKVRKLVGLSREGYISMVKEASHQLKRILLK